jgi:adenylyltransferase/sulfurtransferase
VLKEVLGIGESLSGRLLLIDALATGFQRIGIPKDPGCPLCGESPRYRDLEHHQEPDGEACGLGGTR